MREINHFDFRFDPQSIYLTEPAGGQRSHVLRSVSPGSEGQPPPFQPGFGFQVDDSTNRHQRAAGLWELRLPLLEGLLVGADRYGVPQGSTPGPLLFSIYILLIAQITRKEGLITITTQVIRSSTLQGHP